MNTKLTLLEGKWFPNKHVTVRDLFAPLFTVWTQSSDQSCHYEQFTNEDAFCSAIKHAFKPRHAATIYIGAHGNQNSIHGFHDEGISRTLIRNALNSVSGVTKRGIYFGSCNFGNKKTAAFLLSHCARLEWIAGYHSPVDWIDSTALDLMFFRHFLFPNPGKGRVMPKSTHDRLRYARDRICQDIGPLAIRLGFHVFVRKKGGGIVDLMAATE